jgi:poly-gamma-glutamate synthesis protein (capsule biosynthesis protein)
MVWRRAAIIALLLIAAVLLFLHFMSTPTKKEVGETKSILFLGDTMLGRTVNECILENDAEFVWGDTLPILKSADAVIDNMEAVIAVGGKKWQPEKVFYFKADPKAIDVLKAGNITYVTNANNHAMDYDREALVEMLDHLDKAGIAHSGAGRNLGEAMKPAILSVGPLKIAVIAWTDNEPSWKAGDDLAGVHYLKVTQDSLGVLSGQISEARNDGADLVVIAAHWGPNMVESPNRAFQDFAKGSIDAGADIFYGHSSHVFQGVEVYKGKLIMYDTGDFVDDYAVDPELRNDMSFIFKVIVDETGLRKLELIPVLINGQEFCQVNLAKGNLAKRINEMMNKRSAEFGAEFEEYQEGLSLNLSP